MNLGFTHVGDGTALIGVAQYVGQWVADRSAAGADNQIATLKGGLRLLGKVNVNLLPTLLSNNKTLCLIIGPRCKSGKQEHQ